jgi:hypothetical protein
MQRWCSCCSQGVTWVVIAVVGVVALVRWPAPWGGVGLAVALVVVASCVRWACC